MRKADSRPVFTSRQAKREAKVRALRVLGTPESRKQLKQMNTINMGSPKTNIKGSWCPRMNSSRPVKCSVKSKTRHTVAASKRIMRGLA